MLALRGFPLATNQTKHYYRNLSKTMDINEFLNAMNQVDVNGLVEVAKQVTHKIDLGTVDQLMPKASEVGWIWYNSVRRSSK